MIIVESAAVCFMSVVAVCDGACLVCWMFAAKFGKSPRFSRVSRAPKLSTTFVVIVNVAWLE